MSATHGHNPEAIVHNLRETLRHLSEHEYPFVQGPETLKKRASVALIVRVQPNYTHWPSSDPQPATDLDSFFAQEWVQNGNPEVLFIKRAARQGDRWTSHVAFPGGRRDPEDADDKAVAIRETSEEVGIDLSEGNAISVGNLPQRVVTTHWGKVPLMVLCPYVFLLTRHDILPHKLQPTEVASTHWVPLRSLLSPDSRTVSYEDVSNRLANQETGVKRWMLRAMVGHMIFAGVRLAPSASLYCTASPAEQPGKSELTTFYGSSTFLRTLLDGRNVTPSPNERPLILWGLTLGVLADFLDLIPPHNALTLWTYPTFTPWDVRFMIWAMSYRFKRRKTQDLQLDSDDRIPTAAVEEGLDTVPMPKAVDMKEAGVHGLGTGVDHRSSRMELKSSAVGTMLEGYYDIVRKAVALALIGRTTALVTIAAWLWIRFKRR